MPQRLTLLIEKAYRFTRGLFWQARFGFPARGMRVIAVTGTNGKTTTCAYINEVLKAGGYKTALLTTVYYEVAGEREPNLTHFTVSKQSIVQNFFRQAKKADVDWVIIEVTSHALDQDRLLGVPVRIAVITNLTQDHLDYHKSMKNYAAAKARLLSDYGAKHAILNADDEWYEFFRTRTPAGCEIFAVGTKKGVNGRLGQPQVSDEGGKITFATKNRRLTLKTSLSGEFNLRNAAMAAAVGSIFLLDSKLITKGIASVKELKGRMEPVEAGQNFKVYVDFAITPDALEQALSSLQKTTEGRVHVVFGATGDRDKAKRPIMGEVAVKYADKIYLTDDETYSEDPDKIRAAVYKGIKRAGGEKKTKVIADRAEAIDTALKEAKKGDSVLLTGIGHEDSRNMGGTQIPWDEKQVALDSLARK